MYVIVIMLCMGVGNCMYSESNETFQNKSVCEMKMMFDVEFIHHRIKQKNLDASVAGLCKKAKSI